MVDKTYRYMTAAKCVGGGLVFILLALFFEFILPLPFMPFVALVGAAAFFLLPVLGLNVKEIVVGEHGLILNRRYKPIVMQKITAVREKPAAIRVTGITPGGKTITRPIGKSDLGAKRWEEFKEDLKPLLPK